MLLLKHKQTIQLEDSNRGSGLKTNSISASGLQIFK